VTPSPRVRGNLVVPAADGTALVTDVYLPAGDGPFPVVVTRTCYGRAAHLDEGLGWARRGFAFAVQDVRGRHDSAGDWQPFTGERADGRAFADWLVSQQWCDGLIPMGASYAAHTAWALAVGAPEHVRAVVSLVPAMGPHKVKFDPSGVLRLREHVNWWLAHGDGRTSRDNLVARHPDVLGHLPVADLGDRFWARLPGWWPAVRPWTVPGAAPPPDAVTDDELAALRVPSLHVGGWHDPHLPETLHQWRTTAGAHTPRPASTALIGPWHHELIPLGSSIVDWIADALAGGTPGAHSRLRLVGEQSWREDPAWPPATRTWFACASGLLADRPASGQAASEEAAFHHDPLDPFPSVLHGANRNGLDGRCDAVRFRSPVLAEPLTLLGEPHVDLSARTPAAMADWVVRLSERRADGQVLALVTGVAVTGPGEHRLRIRMGPLGVTIPAGSALELEITGADFPELARNLGTGGCRYTGTETVVTEQVVCTGQAHPTSLALPVLEQR
jgi:putative CocE/NonD family hydrolase